MKRDVDILRALSERCRELQAQGAPESIAKLSKQAAKQAAESAAKGMLDQVSGASGSVAALAPAIKRAAKSLRSLCDAVAEGVLEGAATDVLRAAKASGVRSYGIGQRLTVRREDGWSDAEVVALASTAEHRLRDVALSPEAATEAVYTIALRPWNHAPLQLPSPAFEEVHRWYVETLQAQHSHVLDALSGRRLDVRRQCVPIDVSGSTELSDVSDAASLSAWLRKLHTGGCAGAEAATPCAAATSTSSLQDQTLPPSASKSRHCS